MKPPKEQKPSSKLEHLTVEQSRRRLLMPAALAVPLALYAVRQLDNHHVFRAAFFIVLACIQLISFPAASCRLWFFTLHS